MNDALLLLLLAASFAYMFIGGRYFRRVNKN